MFILWKELNRENNGKFLDILKLNRMPVFKDYTVHNAYTVKQYFIQILTVY